jgi:hydrogenase nickel incorporation protein HypA/HybF
MHEISLVRNIFNTLRSEFTEAEINSIRRINLTAGVLSNIEPQLMQNAFEAVIATELPQLSAAKLHITTLPVIIHCPDCDLRTEVQQYKFVCRQCGRPSNAVVQGDELLISGVELG